MVTIEKQFQLACKLARENEHAIIGFVSSHQEFNRLGREGNETDCVYYLQVGEMRFPNGSLIKWIKPSEEEMVGRYCAWQLTTLFFAADTKVSWTLRDYLRSRLRSTNYKGPLKCYYPSGHAVWEESEVYGS